MKLKSETNSKRLRHREDEAKKTHPKNVNEKKRNGKENQVKSGMRGLHSDCGDDKCRCDNGAVIDALNTFFLSRRKCSLGLNPMNRNEFRTIE